MPGNEWIEAVFEGDEYWDNKSDEEVLAEWLGRWIFLIPENAKSPNYLKELLSTSLARRLLETFNLDVSKIKNKV